MSHANAALTPKARLKLAKLVVDHGWPVCRAAERYDVSWPTAKRWAERYRQHGPAGMADRSSRPQTSPNRTPQPTVRKIVHLRWKQRLGPVAIGAKVGLAHSTVHAVLVRCRINRLSHVDRRTGEPIRRYEWPAPGDMLHVDVKKLGNIPDGGGWRYLGRQHAVLAISEALRFELRALGSPVGVTALCPGLTKSAIITGTRNWPAHLGPEPVSPADSMTEATRARLTEGVAAGVDPAETASDLIQAILNDRFVATTHLEVLLGHASARLKYLQSD